MKFHGTSLRDCRYGKRSAPSFVPSWVPQRRKWKTIVRRLRNWRTIVEGTDADRRDLSASGHRLVPRGRKTRPGILALRARRLGHHPLRDETTSLELRRPFALPAMTMDASLSAKDTLWRSLPDALRARLETGWLRRSGSLPFIRLQLLGRLLIAENLRDCRWALELLARDRRVDSKRLGCVGLSMAGV
jgi:hypothetical protein